ncbi:hypothetical protein [Ornithinimicrobium avium]|uniref:hypothetical protein n=1 Tax=Ornithinimicrobium avium TaxID=2283195 RepID=UPI001D18B2D9|nr:hypothetical protein [Ornithinimicrobium avium]
MQEVHRPAEPAPLLPDTPLEGGVASAQSCSLLPATFITSAGETPAWAATSRMVTAAYPRSPNRRRATWRIWVRDSIPLEDITRGPRW